MRRVWNDLRGRKANWLRLAAKDMAEVTRRDWKQFRKEGDADPTCGPNPSNKSSTLGRSQVAIRFR